MHKERKRLPDILRMVEINAGIDKVWNAISTSEGLANWLMPNTFEAELGSEFRMQAQPAEGWDGIIRCIVKELSPPHRLGFTWGGRGIEFYVRFDLSECDAGTKLTLTHSGWYEGLEALRETMHKGWGYLLEGLQAKQEGKDGGGKR